MKSFLLMMRSTDGTLKILEQISKKKNISFFVLKKLSKDLSKSCFLGFKKSKYENIIVMDGDLQHDPIFLNKMIEIFGNSKKFRFYSRRKEF